MPTDLERPLDAINDARLEIAFIDLELPLMQGSERVAAQRSRFRLRMAIRDHARDFTEAVSLGAGTAD